MIEISKKIILVGQVSVGKTSLVNQFVHHKFSEEYISTIGVRIDKKQVSVGEILYNLIIWDIAGESTQKNTPQSYFLGAAGVIYLVDLSNPASFLSIEQDVEFLKSKLPDSPVIVAGNKVDLLDAKQLENNLSMIPIKPAVLTSAKNNSNVEELFTLLAQQLK